MAVDERDDWTDRRSRAINVHAEALDQQRRVEASRASELLVTFVEQARARGLPSTALHVRSYQGRGRCRTRLTGWYLKPDQTIAVALDGRFYLMTAQLSTWQWLTGWLLPVTLEPAEPGMRVGVGGRDGESWSLPELLAHRLDADW